MRKIRVNVTKKHIKKGVPLESDSCPISLSLKEIGYHCPSVGSVHIKLNDETQVKTPEIARQFIKYFDRKLDLEDELEELEKLKDLKILIERKKSKIKKLQEIVNKAKPISFELEVKD